jgi:hypothetical protein
MNMASAGPLTATVVVASTDRDDLSDTGYRELARELTSLGLPTTIVRTSDDIPSGFVLADRIVARDLVDSWG